MDLLNAIELYSLNEWITWFVNFISIKLLKSDDVVNAESKILTSSKGRCVGSWAPEQPSPLFKRQMCTPPPSFLDENIGVE